MESTVPGSTQFWVLIYPLLKSSISLQIACCWMIFCFRLILFKLPHIPPHARRESSWNLCGLLSRQVPFTGATDCPGLKILTHYVIPSKSFDLLDLLPAQMENQAKSKDCSGNLVLWLSWIDEMSKCTGVSLRLHYWYQWEPQQDLNKRQKIACLAFFLAEQSFIIDSISLETTH